jgi:cytochrome c oxidase subunit 2
MVSLWGIPSRSVQSTRTSRPKPLWRPIGAAAIILLLSSIALSGCSASPSPLAPASQNAGIIYNLTVVVFWIAVAVFVVVEGMLLYSVIRFSRNRIEGEPAQIEGNTKLEIAWTAAPAIVLLIVFFFSLQALGPLASLPNPVSRARTAVDAPAVAPANLRVRVVGHQWWWEFDYPDYQITTANEMHVPVGTTVTVDVQSADVIHSFWVPQLAGKIDVIPGRVNHTWFVAKDVGRFHGQCAEFCGIEHANMRFEVVVEPADQFQVWLQQQQAPVAAKTGEAAKGEQVFMTGACIGCHTIGDTKAQGKVGPNLTHFATRRLFAGGVLDNTPENLTRWLTDPPAVKPGTVMPNLHLSPEQISALVAYLESLN